MTDTTESLRAVVAEFTDYVHRVRGDWSDFDGRELRDEWYKVKPLLASALARLDAMEEMLKEWEDLIADERVAPSTLTIGRAEAAQAIRLRMAALAREET